jgi:Phage derived protein Gp49-like (DUF891)
MAWMVGFVNAAAEAELTALPADMSARFARIADMIQSAGLVAMREPYVKHLTGKLWEMQLKGRDRALDLRGGERTKSNRAANLREEDPDNAAAGD